MMANSANFGNAHGSRHLLACLAWPQPAHAEDWKVYFNQAHQLDRAGRYRDAIAPYKKAIGLGNRQPEIYVAYNNLGWCWCNLNEYDLAIANCTKAIDLNPNYTLAYNNRSYAWAGKHEYDMAIADCNRAIVIDPNDAKAYINRGNAWNGKHEYEKALADSNRAIVIDPNNAKAHNNRGMAWGGKHEYGKAIADFNRAIVLDPDDFDAYTSLAWLRATCPDARYRDGKKAFESASKAYQLDGGKDFNCIDTLAAAYAECGDFDAAKEWEGKAIDLCTKEKLKQVFRLHLESYRQRKPWRAKPEDVWQ